MSIDFKRGVIHTLNTKLLLHGFGVVSSVIYARALGPAGLGAGVFALILPPIVVKFANVGVAGSLTYFANQFPDRRTTYFGTAYSFALALSVVTSVALLTLQPWIMSALYRDQVPSALLTLVFLSTPLWAAQLFLSVSLKALGLIAQYNYIVELAPQLVTFALTIILIVVLGMGVEGYVYVNLAATATQIALALVVIGRRGQLTLGFDRSCMRDMWGYGLRGYFVNVSAALQSRLDRIFVGMFLSVELLGVYQIALSLADKLMILARSVGLPMLPKIAGMRAPEAASFTNHLLRSLLPPTLLMIVMAVAGAPLAIHLLYGEAYSGAFLPFTILALNVINLTGAKLLGNYFQGTGRPGLKSLHKLLVVATSALLLSLLVGPFGTLGAAVASLMAELVGISIAYLAYKRVAGVTGERVLYLDLELTRGAVLAGSRWITRRLAPGRGST